MHIKRMSNRIISFLLCLCMMLSNIAGAMQSVAYAEELEKPIKVFLIQGKNETEQDWLINKNANLEVYSDTELTTLIPGKPAIDNSEIYFASNVVIDSEKTYYYKLTVDEYKEKTGEFKFTEDKDDISIDKEEKEEPIDNNGEENPPEKVVPKTSIYDIRIKDTHDSIQPSEIRFFKSNEEISIGLVDTGYVLTDYIGQEISYEIRTNNYIIQRGSFTPIANEEDQLNRVLEVSLKEKPTFDTGFSAENNVVELEYHPQKNDYGNIYDLLPNKSKYEFSEIDGNLVFNKRWTTDIKNNIDINDSGDITLKGTGWAEFVVYLKGTDYYKMSKAETLRIVSNKVNLGTIKSENIEWADVEKEYDGNSDVMLEGRIKSEKIVGSDSPTIKAKAHLPNSKVGTYNDVQVELINPTTQGLENYDYELDRNFNIPQAKITPKKVTVDVDEMEVTYGSNEWQSIKDNKLPRENNVVDYIKFNDINSSLEAELKGLNLNQNITIDINPKKYSVGEYNDAVTLSVSNEDAGNFKIEANKNKAKLNIKPESSSAKEIEKLIEIDNKNSDKVFIGEDERIYMSPDGVLKFNILENDLYNTLNVISGVDENGEKIVFENELKLNKKEKENIPNEINKGIYLSLKESPDTKTDVFNGVYGSKIRIDNEYPTVRFISGEEYDSFNKKDTNVVENIFKFFKITKEQYVFTVKAFDAYSGLNSVEYAVLDIKDEEDLKNKIQNSLNDNTTSWERAEEFNKEFNISIDKDKSKYSLVVIKATDNVGNTSLTASNGVVIDLKEPVVRVEGIENKVYYDKINYSIIVDDPEINDVHSGVEKVKVTVKRDGVAQGVLWDNVNSSNFDIKDIYKGELNGAPRTFDDLRKTAGEKIIPAVIDLDSNNISLEIEAYDFAGNKIASKTIENIAIDKKQADVNITDSNERRLINKDFYSSNRTIDLTIKERNFKESNVLIKFGFNGGEVKTYTIDQIRQGNAKGVEILKDKSDSEEKLERNIFTDNREIKYTILFGKSSELVSNEYKDVEFIYKDQDGQKDVTPKDKISDFIVDTIKPEAKIIYNKVETKTIVEAGNPENGPARYSEAISAALEIKETNLNYRDVTLIIKATNSNGKAVKVKGTNLRGEYILKEDLWTEENGVHRYDLKDIFSKDANYEITLSVKDKAGNVSDEYGKDLLTIDTKAPNIKVNAKIDGKEESYNEARETKKEIEAKLIKGFIYNIIGRSNIYLSASVQDDTSEIEKIEYALIDARKNLDGDFDLNTLEWKEYKGGIKIDEEKVGMIIVKATDKTGNIAYSTSNGAYIVDKTNPSAPDIKINIEQSEKSKNYKVKIKAEDEDETGTDIYSGVKKIEYKVINLETGRTTQEDSFEIKDARVKNVEKSFNIISKNNNTNNIKVIVKVIDHAGNFNEQEAFYMIDETNPTIEANLDKTGVKNDKYFNTKRNLTVKFRERNFDPDKAQISFKAEGVTYKYSFADLENGKAEAVGLKFVSKEDNQKDIDKQSRNDKREVTYVLAFGENENFDTSYEELKINATDEFGNLAEEKRVEDFVVDNINPIIKTSYKSNGKDITSLITKDKKTTYKTNENISLTVSVQERNFDKKDISANLSEETATGKRPSQYKHINDLNNKNWKNIENLNEITIDDFTGDAIYGLTLEYTDLAGNKADIKGPEYFVVDKTAPTGEIFIISDDNKKHTFNENHKDVGLVKKFVLDIFAKNKIKIDKNAYDDVSGVKTVEYTTLNAPIDAKEDFDLTTEFNRLKWKAWTDGVEINKDTVGTVYLKITDMAGNITYITPSSAYVLDKKNPEKPIIELQEEKDSYGEDISLKVKAIDAEGKDNSGNEDGLYSGIKEIKYTVRDVQADRITDSGSFKNDKPRQKNLSGNITISKEHNDNNNIELRIVVTDYSGNETSLIKYFVIDTKAPEISTELDKTNVKNEKYFNETKEVKVSFKERNFDNSLAKISLNVNGVSKTYTMKDLKSGLGEENYISLKAIKDNQKDLEKIARNDNRLIEYTLFFGNKDNIEIDYTDIKVNATDETGNIGTEATVEDFTIDKIRPVLNIKYKSDDDISVSKTKEEPYYTNKDVVPTLVVNEKNFNSKDIKVSLVEANLNGDTVSTYKEVNKPTGSKWETNNKINSFKMGAFAGDARYELSFEYTDLAGNKAEPYTSDYFVVDKTSPQAELFIIKDGEKIPYAQGIAEKNIDMNPIKKFILNIFAKNKIELDNITGDEVSGVAKVEYVILDAPVDAKEEFNLPGILSGLKWKVWKEKLEINTDTMGTMYLKVTDKSGNTTYVASDKAYILDTENPDKPIIRVQSENNDVHNKDINLKIGVIDQDVNKKGVYSGIKSLRYIVKSNGIVTQDETFKNENSRIKELNKDVVIDSSKNNSNNVVVELEATDYSGNKSTYNERFLIDTTGPEIDLNIDNRDVKNEKYYNVEKDVNVNIKERNFVDENTKLFVTINGEDKVYTFKEIKEEKTINDFIKLKSVSDNQSDRDDREKDDNRTLEYKITFGYGSDIEVDYTNIRVESEDKAKNKAEAKSISDFTIDKIAPVISVKYAQSNADITQFVGKDINNPYYTNTDIQSIVTIEEKNFRKEDVRPHLTQTNVRGEAVEAYKQMGKINSGNWSRSGKTNEIRLDNFTNDARYGFQINYTDLAGNKAKTYDPHYFVIDKTAPTGELFMTIDGKRNPYYQVIKELEKGNKTKDFIFNIFSNKDIYFDSSSEDETAGIKNVSYARIKSPVNAAEKFTTKSDFENIKWEKWTKEIKINGDIAEVFYLRIEDMSGNITYLSSDGGYIRDTKSPDAPILKISGEEKDKYNEDINVKIISSDPDNNGAGVYSGMKEIKYQVINHTTGEVTQKGTFTNKKSRIRDLNESITIDSNKNNSNNVELKVVATDYSGNTSEESAFYMLDRTDPEIYGRMNESGVQNGKYYNSAREVTVTIKERNFDPEKAILSLRTNGEAHEYTFKELENGSAKNFSIEVRDIEDSERNVDDKNRTDNRTITYTLMFGNDQGIDIAYNDIRLNATDQTGNSAKESGLNEFVVDNIAPVIKVNYEDSGDITDKVTTSKEAPYYTNRGVTATISIEENNFRSSEVIGRLTQVDLAEKVVNAYSSMDELTGKSWSRTSNTNTLTLTQFGGDARYAFGLDYTDLAGNKAETYENRYFVVDKTAPVGEITVQSESGAKTYDKLSTTGIYEFITNKNISVSQKSQDLTAGLKSVDYYFHKLGENEKGSLSLLSAEQLRNVNWEAWNNTKTLSPNVQGVAYLRLIDKAGNIAYISANGAVILDSKEPNRPDIKINTKQSGQGFYNGNIVSSISVSDPTVNGTYAGLKTVKIEVLSNNKVTQSQTFNVGGKGDRVKSFLKEITVDAAKNNTNYVKIRVTTTDWANNVSSGEQAIKLDITKPRIEVSYDLNNPLNGKYYNKTRTATIRVYERNFDPNKAVVKVNGGKAQMSSWSIGRDKGVSDNNVNVMTIRFQQDGDYTFNINVTDFAGNSAKFEENKAFTIDQTKPLINVKFDKDLINGKYLSSNRTATITIKEHNFSAKGFDAAIKAIYGGAGITPPSVNGWSSNGDIHTANITFAKDGTYSFLLDYTDLAGNKAEQYKGEEFVIDTSKTEIKFEGIEENSANRGDIDLRVHIVDENFDANGVKFLLKGYNHPEKVIPITPGMMTQIKNGVIIKFPNIPNLAENDDIYTLKVIVKDKAGNTEEKEITFSVNRFGSNYYFSEDTEQFLKKYYNKEAKDIVIYEVNPDELVNQSVSIIKDSETILLKSGDFTVTDISRPGEFKKYKYVIPKSLFKDEGQYDVVINSEDKAGNKQNNKTKESQASFAIDKTKPGAVITGIEDKKVYDLQKRKLVLAVEDNMYISKAEILINGKVVKTYDNESINKLKGKLEYELSQKESWQRVTARVTDGAGNETETEEVSVLISSSSLTRFIHGRGLKYTLFGVLLLTGIFTLLLFLKRRKDEDSDEKEDLRRKNRR